MATSQQPDVKLEGDPSSRAPNFTEAFSDTPAAAGEGIGAETLDTSSLGGYRLCEVIGMGGMGVVYRAEDPRLDRSVAVKVMKAEIAASADMRRRFLREARLQAQVESDHVVAVFAADEFNGIPFLVMPLMRGKTLTKRLREGRVSLSEAIRITMEVALGTAAAHRLDLIHRDIKPSNIWLEESGRAKLMDFGLVRKAVDDGESTASGNIVGTPLYMAPEQAHGQAVDKKADLFSLGCVLYELTTGVRPFAATEVAEILNNVREANPPDILKFNPELPAPLVDLIRRLLAKSPEDRPESAEAVAAELQRIETQAGVPVAARKLAIRRNILVLAMFVCALIAAALLNPFWNRLGSKPPTGGRDGVENRRSNRAFPDLNIDWARRLQQMTRAAQVRELLAEVKRRNPKFSGEWKVDSWDNEEYYKFKMDSRGLLDLAPFAAFPGLLDLECMGDFHDRGSIESLEPLRGMQLMAAGFSHNPICDLSPLSGMPIHSLWIANTDVEDYSPIYAMPLVVLHATSRSPKGRIDAAKLVGKPLTDVWLEPEQTDNFESLRLISTLKLIRNQPANAFWQELDASKRSN